MVHLLSIHHIGSADLVQCCGFQTLLRDCLAFIAKLRFQITDLVLQLGDAYLLVFVELLILALRFKLLRLASEQFVLQFAEGSLLLLQALVELPVVLTQLCLVLLDEGQLGG